MFKNTKSIKYKEKITIAFLNRPSSTVICVPVRWAWEAHRALGERLVGSERADGAHPGTVGEDCSNPAPNYVYKDIEYK